MKSIRPALLLVVLAACDSPAPPPSEGVDVEEGPCGHALYVLNTDYQSTSVAIVGYDGAVLSSSIVHSGSATSGLSVALSGDTVAPTSRTTLGEILLLDRLNAVITVLDPVTATVSGQINVGTGFKSNPHDILELSPEKAYVARYDANPHPGDENFDLGSDVLVLDLTQSSIDARIDLTPAMDGAPEGILARPSRLLRGEDAVFALLAAYSADFKTSAEGRVAVLDPERDEVTGFVTLDGAAGCSGMALSPSAERLAVSCSGTFVGASTPTLEDSAVFVFAVDGAALSLEKRFAAADVGDDPLGFSIAFGSEDELLLGTFGEQDDNGALIAPDRALALSITTGVVRELLRSDSKPFTIGDIRCETECGACFVADADHGVVQRFPLVDGALGDPAGIAIDDGIGLPPRYLGAY